MSLSTNWNAPPVEAAMSSASAFCIKCSADAPNSASSSPHASCQRQASVPSQATSSTEEIYPEPRAGGGWPNAAGRPHVQAARATSRPSGSSQSEYSRTGPTRSGPPPPPRLSPRRRGS
eukprot:940275-Prorocentrum_minimum.AAC.1